MGALLADAAQAETLAVRAARGGANYRFEVSEAGDSALFRRAMRAGAGSIVGPVAQDGAWWVARVTEVLPGRSRSLAETRVEVARRCESLEAERRLRLLAGRLRQTMSVESSPGAAERLREALREMPRDTGHADSP